MPDIIKSDFKLTEKQYDWLHHQFVRWNIKVGAVRSGKTFIDLLSLPVLINKQGTNAVLGFSINTIFRNILMPLMALFPNQVEFKRNSNIAYIFGIPVYLFSSANSHHAARLQGMTLSFAYVDEAQLMDADVFHMLQTRLSAPNAKAVMTANPTNPSSWLYKFIEKNKGNEDFYLQEYILDDNPSLSQSYKDSLKRELSGTVFYDRLILGKWTSSEGLIYSSFTPDLIVPASDVPAKFIKYIVGVDYGSFNATSFVLLGIDREDKVFAIKEYFYSGRDQSSQKTDSEYANDLQAFIAGIPIAQVVIDPSAASFITECKQRRLPVQKADNSVLDGIRVVSSLFGDKKLHVSENCANLLRELQSYRWDSTSGEDRPVKSDDHCVDALRYGVMSIKKQIRVAQFF